MMLRRERTAMSLETCYKALEGDYPTVYNRLNKNERIIKKFVLKFLDDSSYDLLEQSIKVNDYKGAFRAAHTIKGICQNLSFTRLFTSVDVLAEALRNESKVDAEKLPELVQAVERDYKITVDAVRALQAEG